MFKSGFGQKITAIHKTMTAHSAIEVVGVDWGTTHRRAYGLDASGRCVAERADGEGALACKGRFPAALHELLNAMGARPRTVLLSGMVGSALGWQVVPYVDGNVDLPALAQHLLVVDPGALAPGTGAGAAVAAPPACTVAIVPGYCVRSASGQPDVMRGEETQLLGAHCLGHSDGWFVLPGTHSKWVELRAGRVLQLRTYMTGELFDLLSRHGTLAAAATGSDAAWDGDAFAQGVEAARSGGALSHQLFGCRARVVSGDMAAASSRAFLSGLLIGAELCDVLRDATPAGGGTAFQLIGSPALAAHYQAAAGLLGLQFALIDARAAFVAAMHHLNQHRISP
jgi:2-dehydro-3-deoxygalactonokinase